MLRRYSGESGVGHFSSRFTAKWQSNATAGSWPTFHYDLAFDHPSVVFGGRIYQAH